MLKEHPTWYVRDSSKLSTFLDCKRWYFYSYILGWRQDVPAHDAFFGQCWHIGREYQLLHGYEEVEGAYAAFIDEYRKEFDQETDELYKPKNPTGAALGFATIAEQRKQDLVDNEVLFTEISGTVPVDEKRVLHYRMDSIMRRKVDWKIFSWDHKSTKRFSRYWTDNFYLSLQNGTYTHCLYCMYPVEDVLGIEFCGTCFEHLKRGSKYRSQGYHISLQDVSAFKSPDQMNVWLWNMVDLLDDLDREMDRLSECTTSDPVLMAFPMNVNSCTKYFGCPYHDYCMSWPNPLRAADEPPLGFREEYWDPREMKTTHKMDLEWKGGA